MSRIGKMPIPLPASVKATLQGDVLWIEGPKGKLNQKVPSSLSLEMDKNQILVKASSTEKTVRALHGLIRSLVANMVVGTTSGFEKVMVIEGTGYRGAVLEKKLNLQLGFSHPVALDIPKEIEVSVEKQTQITIKGSDKQQVGEWAAKLRAIKPPEPYKGKGVRYKNEVIKKKVGKAAIKQAG